MREVVPVLNKSCFPPDSLSLKWVQSFLVLESLDTVIPSWGSLKDAAVHTDGCMCAVVN